MTTCTAPGCDQPAILQWQRDATIVEADHAVDIHTGTQERIHKHQLTTATSHLIQTRKMHEDAQDAAAKGDHRAAAILTTLHENIAAAEHAVDRLEQDGPITLPDPGTVTVAIFGCPAHAISDDAATWTHQADCLTDPPGRCTCTPPDQE